MHGAAKVSFVRTADRNPPKMLRARQMAGMVKLHCSIARADGRLFLAMATLRQTYQTSDATLPKVHPQRLEPTMLPPHREQE